MKKLLLSGLCISLFSTFGFGQCFNAADDQFPATDYNLPSCGGGIEHTIASDAYASDYSVVNLLANKTYIFSSSIGTDFITISDAGGTIAYAFGLSSSTVTYSTPVAVSVRFYSHADAACTENTDLRARIVECADFVPGPCFSSPTGMWPDDAYSVPACDGSDNVISTFCYAGDYSLVQVESGNFYEFSSSVASDWITIADSAGTFGLYGGPGPIEAQSLIDGYVRFYTHTNQYCGAEEVNRSRIVSCSINVGIVELNSDKVELFPNPSSDKLSIKGDLTFDEIEVVSLDGRLLTKIKPTSALTEIDLSKLANGSYFIKVTLEGKSVTKEFIKN